MVLISELMKVGGELSSVGVTINVIALGYSLNKEFDFLTMLTLAKSLCAKVDMSRVRSKAVKEILEKDPSAGLEESLQIKQLQNQINQMKSMMTKTGKKNTYECYNCNRKGHMMMDCKEEQKFKTSTEICSECKRNWEFIAESKAYHSAMGKTKDGYQMPTRCKDCRKARKNNKSYAMKGGEGESSGEE
jgi:hypothetical protein